MESILIWEPTTKSKQESHLARFISEANKNASGAIEDWHSLYQWSINSLADFWELTATFCGIKWLQPYKKVYKAPPEGCMRGAEWFLDGRLNFCQNLLPSYDQRTVITSYWEGFPPIKISGVRLWHEVDTLSKNLRMWGVRKGDHVSGVVSNTYHAIVAMLATTSLGAVWSSCSPDFGVASICDRLEQIKPKVLFFTCAYSYQGKIYGCADKIKEILDRLPSVNNTVAIDLGYEGYGHVDQTSKHVLYHNLVSPHPAGSTPPDIPFEAMSFQDPVYILFTSGTTGLPKGIIHSVGGTLLQHKKELMLHCDMKVRDSLFFHTTCGWMMWNWMVSALSAGVSIITMEGHPLYPNEDFLWRLVEEEKINFLGISPKFIASLQALGRYVRGDFPALRCILTTGAPLLPEQAVWINETIKKDLHVASISGGTDIISCFMLGNPFLPVYAGEIQSPGLGMDIAALNEQGQPVVGEKGELVCRKPFVSMPIGLLNDPDGSAYKKAYFSHYPDPEVWRHGDFIEWTSHQGIIVHGRSDATLNPGGVRIGTAEIYRRVLLKTAIEDAVAVEFNGEILLLVKMASGKALNDKLVDLLKNDLYHQLSPRHVPKKIIAVKDIPYTRSGKKMEITVSLALQGKAILNLAAIANPECLEEYMQLGKALKP